eukprot:scaffold144609_cov30-Tisochrysis_lutea.AAC.2
MPGASISAGVFVPRAPSRCGHRSITTFMLTVCAGGRATFGGAQGPADSSEPILYDAAKGEA